MVQARRIDDDRSSTRCAWFFNGIPWGGNRWCCCVTNQRPRVHNKSQLELPPKAYDDMKDFGIRYSESAHILARPEESTIGCLPRVYTVGHLQGLPRLYKYGDPKSQSLFPVYRSDEPPAPIHICSSFLTPGLRTFPAPPPSTTSPPPRTTSHHATPRKVSSDWSLDCLPQRRVRQAQSAFRNIQCMRFSSLLISSKGQGINLWSVVPAFQSRLLQPSAFR